MKIPFIPSSKMKIVSKLSFGYVTVVLIMAIVSYFGVKVFNRANGEFDKIADQTIPVIETLGEIKIIGLRLMLSTDEYLHPASIKNSGENADRLKSRENAAFALPLTKLDVLIRQYFPEELVYLDSIKGAAGRLERMSVELMLLKDQGRSEAKLLVKRQEFREACEVFENVINEALAHEEKEFVERKDGVKNAITQAVNTIIYVGLGTFALAIILGFFISRSLVVPISHLQRAAVEIGAGKLDTEIEIESEDEFGNLARTFKKMAKDLKTSLHREISLATASSAALAASEVEKKKAVELREMILARDREIIERKRVEGELKDSSEKIKMFAYYVSHDLKNPAIAIHGLAKLLARNYGDVLSEKGGNICTQIVKSSEQVAALAEKINIYISSRESPAVFEKVPLKELCRTIREEFSVRLADRQIHWQEPDFWPEVMADRLSLLRVLRNLVDNALKYGGAELSKVEFSYKESADFFVLSVKNDGACIAQEDCDKIFGVFKRVNATGNVEGTGLGLAIVKEIAEQHGGTVWVEPVIGPAKGTIFNVSIAKNFSTPT